MSDARIQHIRKIMREQGVDGFLISSKSNIFYLSGFNRFLQDHDGYLLITQMSAYLITSPLYTQAVKKFTPDLAMLETSADSWYFQLVKQIVEKEHFTTIGFEEFDLRVGEYFDLQDQQISLKSVSLRNLRLQKDSDEISAIKTACEITDKTFQHILQYVHFGISELALAEQMDNFVKEQNAEIGFPSIVAFGQHAAVPHHMTSDEKLQKNSFILFDFGVQVGGYVSDMSRTVFFGKPTEKDTIVYETAKRAQQEAITYIEKNLPNDIFVKDVDHAARAVIEKVGFPTYPHSLGHGVGLEVHEAPTVSQYSPEKLIQDIVFTIEPGVYLPEIGGVRIEDVFTIENGKLLQLTKSSKELIVI